MSDPHEQFSHECLQRARSYPATPIAAAGKQFMLDSTETKYSYNFRWMGRPIIQYPQDMTAIQEVIWDTRPDLVIETGIAHGGSLIMTASLLAMLDYCDAVEQGTTIDPANPNRQVLAVDIDIREHNRAAIEAHPMSGRITMLQGSSVESSIIDQVQSFAGRFTRVMVCLDSNHTHDHVLAELEAYAPLVSSGCYCVVFDTIVEDVPSEMYPDRSWGPGNSPKSAAQQYCKSNPEFSVDHDIDSKLLISVAPEGYLKRS